MLRNPEMATASPPFGPASFAMNGIAPPDAAMGDVYRAAFPFVGLNPVVMAARIAVPAVVPWPPGLMG